MNDNDFDLDMLPDPEDDEIEIAYRLEEEHERRIEGGFQKIFEGFDVLKELLGHDTAWKELSWFTRHVKPPRRKKGKHNPSFDKALLAAHSSAPAGQKMAAVYGFANAKGISKSSAERHLRRLIKEKRALAQALELYRNFPLPDLPPEEY